MRPVIEHINISVTNRCNLHCKQCSIWNESPKVDLSLDNLDSLLGSGILNGAGIALTGGEPFLHEGFGAIVDRIISSRPGSLKNITTNCTVTEPMFDFLKTYHGQINECALHISIDGINSHDKQRGESLDLILNNIKRIRNTYPDIHIRIKFTITKINYKDIIPTYRFAHDQGLDFKVKLAENAVNYTNRIFGGKMSVYSPDEEKAIIKDLYQLYKEYTAQKNKDAEFIAKTIEFIREKDGKGFCKTPFNRIFVMPDGEVYSCIHYRSIGNLNRQPLNEIWSSAEAGSIRSCIDTEGCGKCIAYHGYSPD